MKVLLCTLALAALVFTPQAPAVDDATEKTRLETALKATGLTYEPSPSGLSFKLTYDHGGPGAGEPDAAGQRENRQQTVYVGATPSRPGKLVVHSIYSVAWIGGAEEPGEELLLHLLTATKKLGSFYVHQDSQGIWTIRFGVQFDATDLTDESKEGDPLVARLRDTIAFVNLVGEEADAAVNGEQDVR